MRYIPKVFRPPSESDAYILQATIGCSWNNCTYCHMYQDKTFSVRPLSESLQDIDEASAVFGDQVEKVFVADGDALILPMDHWKSILTAVGQGFPRVRRVSCYAMASNIVDKTLDELICLRQMGLTTLYIGPESGDETTMRRIAKGRRPSGAPRSQDYLFDSHALAANKAKEAGMKISAIFLLGAGGVSRSQAHAEGSARLITAMNPEFLAALTLTIVPGTSLAKTKGRLGWKLPDIKGLLGELRTMVGESRPTNALFRTNHASNYLPLGGTLPADRQRICDTIDAALTGRIPLRPEWTRGL